MESKLILSDGATFSGVSFGAPISQSGEVVFTTGMTGYPQAFTDPSFGGQILVMTYPLLGNYGVPNESFWESNKLQIRGLIVSAYNDTPSHFQSTMTLAEWLKKSKIPALEIKDTRLLTQLLRDKGVMLGKIMINKKNPHDFDPNKINMVADVSTKHIMYDGSGEKTVVLIDCGAKRNIQRSFVERGVKTITIPWDYDPFEHKLKFDALFISNGPGDPKMANQTIKTIQKALDLKIPTLGICLGNQLLALAAGGDTYKMKFGHRSQNQPCIQVNTKRCYITSQNHGFAIGDVPRGFTPWFVNANDKSVEGIIHTKHPFMSVQFHPESTPGPLDTEWIFDYFLGKI